LKADAFITTGEADSLFHLYFTSQAHEQILIALILGFTTAGASAMTWPWEETAPTLPSEYCKD